MSHSARLRVLTGRSATAFATRLATLVTLWSGTAFTAEESVLNIYNWADYIDPALVIEFERAFGISVNYDIYDSSELVDLIADAKPGPESLMLDAEHQEWLLGLLDVLDPRARRAVERRFGLDDGRRRSYREVGEDLEVTAEAARRLVKRAIRTIRERAEEDSGLADVFG